MRVGREWITTVAEVEHFASLDRPAGAAGHLAKRKPIAEDRGRAGPAELRVPSPKPIRPDSPVPAREWRPVSKATQLAKR